MKVLLVGSGAREHALAWKIAQSPALSELHAAPGNPGIAGLGRCHPLRVDDVEGLLALCREQAFDLVVVGPEAPLVAGVADGLRRAGVAVFGPGASAARIEGSKSFAKEIMRAAGVPTAAELEHVSAPCVIKADGLAAGKGVFVCRTEAEAQEAWKRAQALGDRILVEELLDGEEVSVFAVTDGVEAVLLALLASAAEGRLDAREASASADAAVTVVLAAGGYPDAPVTGAEIRGVAEAEATGALVFHAGTALRAGRPVSAGGRVLSVTATAPTVVEARDRAYEAVALIDFEGAQYRSDIALKAGLHVAS